MLFEVYGFFYWQNQLAIDNEDRPNSNNVEVPYYNIYPQNQPQTPATYQEISENQPHQSVEIKARRQLPPEPTATGPAVPTNSSDYQELQDVVRDYQSLNRQNVMNI